MEVEGGGGTMAKAGLSNSIQSVRGGSGVGEGKGGVHGNLDSFS